MSRELLAGRLTPTEIIGRHLYDEAFAAHGREVASWYESLSTEQREAEAERAREHLDGLARDEVQTPTAGTPWRARRQETDEDEEDLSLRETWRRKPKR
ncbi:hypothetical protein EV193_101356 [Herbihabitans rhizosphaerae]|uniref:Uncharacterized protein n=2 Tax=Herbihabitans rhizosphaerae TaxID=1872711 RepID=A0A4Q7L6I6_9PSEU|nr:hypothetical protein EV193_101356 [Herbihabitans rhizosphaerae]